jgi:hypothetical protein
VGLSLTLLLQEAPANMNKYAPVDLRFSRSAAQSLSVKPSGSMRRSGSWVPKTRRKSLVHIYFQTRSFLSPEPPMSRSVNLEPRTRTYKSSWKELVR